MAGEKSRGEDPIRSLEVYGVKVIFRSSLWEFTPNPSRPGIFTLRLRIWQERNGAECRMEFLIQQIILTTTAIHSLFSTRDNSVNLKLHIRILIEVSCETAIRTQSGFFGNFEGRKIQRRNRSHTTMVSSPSLVNFILRGVKKYFMTIP